MEFVFGISSERPKRNGMKPRWEDETITAYSSHTYLQLMEKLCNTSISKRRQYENDSSIHAHLWKLKISSEKNFMMNPRDDSDSTLEMFQNETRRVRREARRLLHGNDEEGGVDGDSDDDASDSEDGDDSDVEHENRYRPSIVIHTPEQEQFDDSDNEEGEIISATHTLSKTHLPQGTMITVTYDYGSTTKLYLKVLHCRPSVVQSLLSYFTTDVSEADIKKALDAVPAYKLPKDKQIDAFYPHFSKIVMGKYVPIIQPTEGEVDTRDGHMNQNDITSSIILGKSACIRTKEDIQFCAIEGRTGNDVMHCVAMESIYDFLDIAEQAWTPRNENEDADNLTRFRHDCIMRHLVAADNDELYTSLQEMIDQDGGYGAKHVIVRGKKDCKKPSGFDFEKVFPLTFKMLTGDYFRWFQFKNNILHVLVGRGVGPYHRDYENHQILKTWRYSFESFHDVLCAVEASWVWKGKTMTCNQFLMDYDEFVGPSNLSKDPPVLGKEEECVTIVSNSDLKKLVTALAITQEEGINILYSGHNDGTLTKWDLDDNTQIWSKVIYKQDPEGRGNDQMGNDLNLSSTFGVAGIAIRPAIGTVTTDHVIWTWTHAPGGYPEENIENCTSSELSCWNQAGVNIKRLACDVGEDEEGDSVNPSIGPVVFCDLNYQCKDSSCRWFPSIVVGMQCCTQAIDWKGDYSEFDLDLTQIKSSEGNIRVFDEKSGEECDSWIDKMCMIKSLAVVPKKYVISLSFTKGCGFPEALILWDVYNPGCPFSRLDFCSAQSMSIPKERLGGVCGLNAHGNYITFVDDYGARIAGAIVKKDEDGEPFIKFNGYGEVNRHILGMSCIGRAAVCGDFGAMANEDDSTVCVFKTSSCADHEDLDKRKISRREFRQIGEEDEEEEEEYSYAGRKMLTGMVKFPRFGGNKPIRKKETTFESFAIASQNRENPSDGLGNGGPTSLAMRGKFLIVGYSNGTITRAPFLPPEFELGDEDDVSANHLSCTSDIPSDMWNNPTLAPPEEDSAGQCIIS